MTKEKSWLEVQYDQGRKLADSGTANPWRRGTDCWNAWDQGRRGVPFSIVDQPAEPKPVKPAGLFDKED